MLLLPFTHFQLVFWLQPIVAGYSHLKNLWTKPGEQSVHTHTSKKETNPFMHTDYIYLFIYHVCMHSMKCVCEFVHRLYCKKRWHLWTYLKIKVNICSKQTKKRKPYLSKTQVGTNSHSTNIYKIFIFRGECFLKITNPKPYSSHQPPSDGPF